MLFFKIDLWQVNLINSLLGGKVPIYQRMGKFTLDMTTPENRSAQVKLASIFFDKSNNELTKQNLHTEKCKII